MRAERLVGLFSVVFLLFAMCGITAAGADPASVQVSAKSIDFGAIYDAETFTGTGAVVVTASAGLAYRVALDGGVHYSAGVRHLKRGGGAEAIPYNLFSDAGCAVPWGDSDLGATCPTGRSVSGTGTGRGESMTVYGLLTVPALLPPGVYLDNITICVDY